MQFIGDDDKIKLEKAMGSAETNGAVLQLIPQPYKDIFAEGILEHILLGEAVNKQAKGFHTENMPQPIGKIVLETLEPEDQNKVYRARAEINDIQKKNLSTFYPKNWSPLQVTEAIYEAYYNRVLAPNKQYKYKGKTKNGLTIVMYLDETGKIKMAYPEYKFGGNK